MDRIREALERARAQTGGSVGLSDRVAKAREFGPEFETGRYFGWRGETVELNTAHLEANRIVAHDDRDPRSKAFDMLRTQVLQAMDQKNWRMLGITSPTPGCGKTVTSVNLALSIARQPERASLLLDLDLQKPQVAATLGLLRQSGVISVLDGKTNLSSTIIAGRVGDGGILVLPTETPQSGSSARLTSPAMNTMLQEVRRDFRAYNIIVDLPPMLASDDVIALLPQLDCVLLVAAVGKSTVAEIEECNKHLHTTPVLRLVLNKVPRPHTPYYAYY